MTSWKPEVSVGPGQWAANSLRFTTEADARRWAEGLARRWTLVINYRASPCEDPPNCTLDILGRVQDLISEGDPA